MKSINQWYYIVQVISTGAHIMAQTIIKKSLTNLKKKKKGQCEPTLVENFVKKQKHKAKDNKKDKNTVLLNICSTVSLKNIS